MLLLFLPLSPLLPLFLCPIFSSLVLPPTWEKYLLLFLFFLSHFSFLLFSQSNSSFACSPFPKYRKKEGRERRRWKMFVEKRPPHFWMVFLCAPEAVLCITRKKSILTPKRSKHPTHTVYLLPFLSSFSSFLSLCVCVCAQLHVFQLPLRHVWKHSH